MSNTKDSNKETKELLVKLLMFVFAILGLLMVFFDFAKLGSEGFTGLAVIFGAKKSMHGTSTNFLGFSFFEFLPFICLVANAVLIFLMADGLLAKKIVVKGIVVVLFIIAAIFFSFAWLTPNVVVNSSATFSIGIGAILAAVFSFIGGLIGLLDLLKTKEE